MSTPLYAQATGNINDALMWNTATDGSGSDVAFASVDINYSLNAQAQVVDINVSVTCDFLTNSTGKFTLSTDGLTITANIVAVGEQAVEVVLTDAGHTLTIVGDITGGSTVYYSYGVWLHGLGTVDITGDLQGGSNNYCSGVHLQGDEDVNITGDIYAGTDTSCFGLQCLENGGDVVVIGDCFGGGTTYALGWSGTSTLIVTGNHTSTVSGIFVLSAGTVVINGSIQASDRLTGCWVGGSCDLTVNGNVTGGLDGSIHGLTNDSSGEVIINGDVTGGTDVGAVGAYQDESAATLIINGNVRGGTSYAAGGIYNYRGDMIVNGNFIYKTGESFPIRNGLGRILWDNTEHTLEMLDKDGDAIFVEESSGGGGGGLNQGIQALQSGIMI